jgi:ABC-type transport system substrate-binding protein
MARTSRFAAALTLLVGLVLLAGPPDLSAQKPKPRREEEEEPVKKPLKKAPKGEEEEEPAKAKLKPPLRIDDEPKPERNIGARPVDLAREAEQAKNTIVRDFYRRLAVPHDEVNVLGARQPLSVEPLAEYIGPKPTFEGKLKVQPLPTAEKSPKEQEYPRRQIGGVEHYEALAMSQSDRFLEQVKASEVPRLEALQHVEKALGEVTRYHEFARERGVRKGGLWDPLERELRAKLRGVRLTQLGLLADARDWASVVEMANQLAEIYPHDAEVATAIVGVRSRQFTQALDDDKVETYVAARQGLEQLERQFPEGRQHEAAQVLRDRLKNKASNLLRRAAEAAPKDKGKAIALLRTVENVWPQLPGLQELRQQLRPYTPLGVGVRQLPVNLSPATAVSDAEKQGVELIFESLLRPVADAQVGQRYEPVLAAAPPRTSALARDFQLVPGATWYRLGKDGKDTIERSVEATDVSRTIALYREWAGRSPEWNELLGDPLVERKDELRLTLRRGYLDPLSLMTFKVLPSRLLDRPDDPVFARDPIGSGPYQYLGIQNKGKSAGEFALFLANPTYARRAGKQELPRIPAIHFYRSRDVVGDFKSGQLHLLLDLPTERIKEITNPMAGLNRVHVYTLRNRRVWFLAVNHRQPILQNENVRRALGHAIDREKILNDIFRDGYRDERGDTVHRSLTGPFPANSWACDPGVKDLYKPDLAKTLINTVTKRESLQELRLLYPKDVAHAEEACKAIQEQAQTAGLKLILKEMTQAEVHQAVARDHKYELAYFFWDYPSDAYWLGPLFDAAGAGPGGPNFLGPLKDGELETLLSQLQQHRDFAEIQRLTRQVHRLLAHKMPLIPLWQLDTHIAVHNDLRMVPASRDIDPLLIFTNVEQWRLEK